MQRIGKKRVVCEEKDKQEIAKYAAVCGVTAAIRKFKQKFPNLNESTVRPGVKKYKEILKAKKNNGESGGFPPKIGQVRGRPLLLDNELDLKPTYDTHNPPHSRRWYKHSRCHWCSEWPGLR